MKRVRQEHPTGCGIACIAMVCGTTYSNVMNEAKELLGWDNSQKTFYTDSSHLQKLLHAMKVNSQKGRSVGKWGSLPNTAIAGINYDKKHNRWHWVVFCREVDREYVLDPRSKREERTDFGRMRLRSCIPIDG